VFEGNERLIGEPAKTKERSNFKNTVHMITRLLDINYESDVAEFEKWFLSCQTVPNKYGKLAVKVH
jgi:molecular chaperone DnaK (HSP70)